MLCYAAKALYRCNLGSQSANLKGEVSWIIQQGLIYFHKSLKPEFIPQLQQKGRGSLRRIQHAASEDGGSHGVQAAPEAWAGDLSPVSKQN